jgi:cytochrome c oxidase subunit 2
MPVRRGSRSKDKRKTKARRPGTRWVVIGAVAALVGLAAQTSVALAVARPSWNPGPPWAPLHPHSSEMNLISNLFWETFILSAIIFAIVVGGVLMGVFRFRARRDSPQPPQVAGNRTVEFIWTLIPTIILMVAFVVTAKGIHDINTLPPGKHMDVYAIGHQWWWEFQYPKQGNLIPAPIDTANEIHVPTGYSVHYHITSVDVIHSFWVPQLQRQIDANPGQDNAVYVKLTEPGIYGGACYEYCGDAHAWMKFRTVVQSPAQFAAWVKQQTSSPAPVHGMAAQGKKLFLASTCANCHAITGTPAGGVVGPNLTHVASRWSIGAGAAPVDTSDMMAWIQDPNTYKPGVVMPGYPLFSQQQLRALAAYLLSLK